MSAGSLLAAAGETSYSLVINQQSGANWPLSVEEKAPSEISASQDLHL